MKALDELILRLTACVEDDVYGLRLDRDDCALLLRTIFTLQRSREKAKSVMRSAQEVIEAQRRVIHISDERIALLQQACNQRDACNDVLTSELIQLRAARKKLIHGPPDRN